MRERRWFCSACEHTFEVDEDFVFTYPDGMEFVVCPVCSLNAFLHSTSEQTLKIYGQGRGFLGELV